MGSSATQALADSAEGINLASDFRKGDTATLGITQAIQPVQYKMGSDVEGSLAGTLGSMAGNAWMKGV
jgi:hypothetical protein